MKLLAHNDIVIEHTTRFVVIYRCHSCSSLFKLSSLSPTPHSRLWFSTVSRFPINQPQPKNRSARKYISEKLIPLINDMSVYSALRTHDFYVEHFLNYSYSVAWHLKWMNLNTFVLLRFIIIDNPFLFFIDLEHAKQHHWFFLLVLLLIDFVIKKKRKYTVSDICVHRAAHWSIENQFKLINNKFIYDFLFNNQNPSTIWHAPPQKSSNKI